MVFPGAPGCRRTFATPVIRTRRTSIVWSDAERPQGRGFMCAMAVADVAPGVKALVVSTSGRSCQGSSLAARCDAGARPAGAARQRPGRD